MQLTQKTKIFYCWIVAFLVLKVNTVFADDDPFSTGTEKVNLLVTALSGPFTVALLTLVIIFAGLAMLFNKLRMDWALKIGGGALLILVAGQLAGWWLS